MPFVSTDDVRNFIRKPHASSSTVQTAIRMAEGWALGAAPHLQIPTEQTTDRQDLWAWLVELAGIAADNPTGLAGKAVGSVNQSWNLARRGEILDAIKNRYGGSNGAGGPASPRGSFPLPTAWPDPAERVCRPRGPW